VTMRFGLLFILVIALCAACGGDTATSRMAPTSPMASTLIVNAYEGTWTGQTSQSERFGFIVAGNQVTRLDFNVSYTGISCLGAMGAGTDALLALISNAEFSGAHANPSRDMTWSVAGTFVSETKATGTLQVTITHNPTGPVCSPNVQVTWTAQKGS
jgi:hypothetical protein